MPMDQRAAAMLPYAVPDCPYSRLLLFGVRRMAAAGLNDAHATHAFLTGFGLFYRRPVILLRAFMAESSRCKARFQRSLLRERHYGGDGSSPRTRRRLHQIS